MEAIAVGILATIVASLVLLIVNNAVRQAKERAEAFEKRVESHLHTLRGQMQQCLVEIAVLKERADIYEKIETHFGLNKGK